VAVEVPLKLVMVKGKWLVETEKLIGLHGVPQHQLDKAQEDHIIMQEAAEQGLTMDIHQLDLVV
jgi:hypothetical protein